MNPFSRRALALALIAGGSIACDQGTKRVADLTLRGGPSIDFLDHTVRFVYAQNSGAWGSLGAQWPETLRMLVLLVLPAVVLAGLAFQVLTRKDMPRLEFVAGALFVGGGFGNLIDRALRGSVIDFVIIGRGWLSTNVFNVADVALMVAIGLFLLSSWKRRKTAPATPSGP